MCLNSNFAVIFLLLTEMPLLLRAWDYYTSYHDATQLMKRLESPNTYFVSATVALLKNNLTFNFIEQAGENWSTR